MASEHPSRPSTWPARFNAEPFTRVESNEWYGVADDAEGLERRQYAKTHFMVNQDLSAPDLDFPKLKELRFSETERVLQGLLKDSDELPASESDAAYERTARKLAELYRHQEIIRGIGLVAERHAISRRRAGDMTRELFGSPETKEFAPLVQKMRDSAERLRDITPIANELLGMLGTVESIEEGGGIELSDETLQTVRGDIEELYPSLTGWLKGNPEEVLGTEEATRHLENLLDITGLAAQGWIIRTVDGESAAATHKSQKEITIGSDRLMKLTRGQLIKTGVHEVLGHASRRPTGLHNLAFEEGFGTALEQVVSGEKRVPGEQYYTALALQLGLDRDSEPRTFREVYEILWRRSVLEDIDAGKPEDIEQAKQKAYRQCMRTMRGGALDARDISYSEGAKRAHPWLNNLAGKTHDERINELALVLRTSFDPTNEEHRARVEAL